MHPTEPVSLADIHLWRYLFIVVAIYSPILILSRLMIRAGWKIPNLIKKDRGGYTPAP